MSEERLKKIKDIFEQGDIYGDDNDLSKELYNEVIRLKEIIQKASDKVSAYTLIKAYYDYTEDGYDEIAEHDNLQEELLDILKGE